jgi:hypothetical protein
MKNQFPAELWHSLLAGLKWREPWVQSPARQEKRKKKKTTQA